MSHHSCHFSYGRSFRNWSIHQDRNPRWVGPRGSAPVFKSATDTFGLIGLTMYQTRHSGASSDRVRGVRTLQEVQTRGQWKAFSSVTRYDKSSRLAADCHSETSWKKLAQRGEVLTTKQLPAACRRMTGKYMLDVLMPKFCVEHISTQTQLICGFR